jgi:uncharacterized protein YbaR (Trm112 family)
MGEPVRCSQCSRWLGVQDDGYVESRHKGRAVKVVTGEIICEQCGALVQIQDGCPVATPVGLVAR